MGITSHGSDMLEEDGVVGLFAAYTLERPQTADDDVEIFTEEVSNILKDSNRSEEVLVDTYLLSGLTPGVDYLVRIHAHDLTTAQEVLREFQATSFGRYSKLVDVLIGIIRDAVYLPQTPDLDAIEKAATFEGTEPPDYAIIIPVDKNAEWWNLPDSDRIEKMRDHIEVALPYLDRIRRQLYHSSGLTDYDYITYFETNDLSAFIDLYRDLESIPEYHYVSDGNPTLIGRIESSETIVDKLLQSEDI